MRAWSGWGRGARALGLPVVLWLAGCGSTAGTPDATASDVAVVDASDAAVDASDVVTLDVPADAATVDAPVAPIDVAADVPRDAAVLDAPSGASLDAAPDARDAASDAGVVADVPRVVGPFVSRRVVPRDTDPSINTFPQDHVVMIGGAAPLGRLYLHLPGTTGEPRDSLLLLNTAALAGFHVVGLMYPNPTRIGALCDALGDACYENARLETLDGTDRTTVVTVDRANSIENRLVRLLQYLSARYPAEGWDAYLDGALPRWSAIAVGGHSQGGGHAAMIARVHAVARVALFSSPTDGEPDLAPAWVRAAHATPSERYYGLVHSHEDGYSIIATCLTALGLGAPGTEVDVARGRPPYDHTHRLVTAVPGGKGDDHGSTAVDYATPRRADESPALDEAWRYMLGAGEP